MCPSSFPAAKSVTWKLKTQKERWGGGVDSRKKRPRNSIRDASREDGSMDHDGVEEDCEEPERKVGFFLGPSEIRTSR